MVLTQAESNYMTFSGYSKQQAESMKARLSFGRSTPQGVGDPSFPNQESVDNNYQDDMLYNE
jgi:hypothetical protein